MGDPFVKHPRPDWEQFRRVVQGQAEPRRVHLMEMGIDVEVMQAISQQALGRAWAPLTDDTVEAYCLQVMDLYHRLGYDFVNAPRIIRGHPTERWAAAADTATYSRGQRRWVTQQGGLITSWEEFEAFPWGQVRLETDHLEFMARRLPDGMKLVVTGLSLFEWTMERLLGPERLFYLLYDQPDLVRAVFDRWGAKVYECYQATVGMEGVGAILHPDDLGHKTSTTISLKHLQELVFPWHKKYAALAHAHSKLFWHHCCGSLYPHAIEVMMDDVGIDGLHSFQDVILPAAEFKARYGQRVAALGGVDMDKLVRLDEASLRAYVREILAACMPGGRFALGSGNTIANYVPLGSYFAMLDEARRWTA
ncbi:MAG: hypothetical protein GX605_09060 [Chloroflexi bacterium]|nr:hypothetical protein [Chloroflexota bacterium]